MLIGKIYEKHRPVLFDKMRILNKIAFLENRLKYVNKGRIVIMAKEPIELTTDVPEHAFLEVSYDINRVF